MGLNVSPPPTSSQLLSSEGRVTAAKSILRKTEIPSKEPNALYAAIGGCFDEVRRVCGLSLEEFAHALGKNDRQVARQIKGEERPQIEVVLAVREFRAPLVIALSRITEDIEVSTELRWRRPA